AADDPLVRIAAAVAMSTLAFAAPALASNGGTGVPDTANGGVLYGQAVRRIPALPVLRRFAIEHRRVLVRIDREGARRVRVSVRLRRGRASRLITRTIRTGQRVAIALPRLGPGHWTIRLRVTGLARVSGRRLVVHEPHRPKVKPAPPDGGVFPVAGSHTSGDGI